MNGSQMTFYGFYLGQTVRLRVETMGEDHKGVEHTLPVGRLGIIEMVDVHQPSQGVAFTIRIPVDHDRSIVNVFDQDDGPIFRFIEPLED